MHGLCYVFDSLKDWLIGVINLGIRMHGLHCMFLIHIEELDSLESFVLELDNTGYA